MPVATATIATALSDAPGWALISLTMPDDQLRDSGALELARWIAGRFKPPVIIEARSEFDRYRQCDLDQGT